MGWELAGLQARDTVPARVEDAAKEPRPRPRAMLEQSSEFFVSITAQAHYSGPPTRGPCSAGTAAALLIVKENAGGLRR
jgi:hypothetical protein